MIHNKLTFVIQFQNVDRRCSRLFLCKLTHKDDSVQTITVIHIHRLILLELDMQKRAANDTTKHANNTIDDVQMSDWSKSSCFVFRVQGLNGYIC